MNEWIKGQMGQLTLMKIERWCLWQMAKKNKWWKVKKAKPLVWFSIENFFFFLVQNWLFLIFDDDDDDELWWIGFELLSSSDDLIFFFYTLYSSYICEWNKSNVWQIIYSIFFLSSSSSFCSFFNQISSW